ncbi:MAG: sigma-70 family RNA polymerase sigma factor, partial [Bacteroidota bacterium]
ETVIRAYSHRDKFREGTNFKAWISTIMRNTFTNRYHQKKRRAIVDGPVELYPHATDRLTVFNTSESNMMIDELIAIVEKVDVKYRVPFLLSYQGFEYQEISKQLGIPIGTVKSRLYTARQQLKILVRNHYGEIGKA